MTKIGRNTPCPCGSGKKYKRCCLSDVTSTTRVNTTRPRTESHVFYEPVEDEHDIDKLSNSVVDLIDENRLDEAEEACARLLEEFPDCVDGIERLVAVHEARGNFKLAAEYARQTVAFMKEHVDHFDPELIEDFEDQERNLKQRATEAFEVTLDSVLQGKPENDMSDKETKVLGFIAVVPGSISVLCDGDSCIVIGSEKALKQYIKLSATDPDVGYRITKARYGHVLKAMKMGGAYSFDRASFSRFCPLAAEDGIDLVDFTPTDQAEPESGTGIPLMRIQWIPEE